MDSSSTSIEVVGYHVAAKLFEDVKIGDPVIIYDARITPEGHKQVKACLTFSSVVKNMTQTSDGDAIENSFDWKKGNHTHGSASFVPNQQSRMEREANLEGMPATICSTLTMMHDQFEEDSALIVDIYGVFVTSVVGGKWAYEGCVKCRRKDCDCKVEKKFYMNPLLNIKDFTGQMVVSKNLIEGISTCFGFGQLWMF